MNNIDGTRASFFARLRYARWTRLSLLLALAILLVGPPLQAQKSPHVGLKIRSVTTELRKQHKLPTDLKGALVTAVTEGSPAQEKGIRAGEVIVEAAGKPVGAAKDVATEIATASAAGKETIVFRVANTAGDSREVTLPLGKRPADGSKALLAAPSK